MLVAVVGGNLQGVEATYLAHKAGWEVLLIDKKGHVPASGMCDIFVQLEVNEEQGLDNVLNGVDLVIPALENEKALAVLGHYARNSGIPFAFDSEAYEVSLSKKRSNRLFATMGLPAPKTWPECGFPVIAKPNKGSGSSGIRIIRNNDEWSDFISESILYKDWVLQEFISGPSYSLEVIGVPRKYVPIQVTDLFMDVVYDCKRVIAPTELPPEYVSEFEKVSMLIAGSLNLRGLMDVEVIFHCGVLKVLEVDARLPSQTPITVYWSTGVNLVHILRKLFLHGHDPYQMSISTERGVVLEHIKVSPGLLEITGEHIMSGIGPLRVYTDFFGADEAITNYASGRDEWVATLICTGSNRQEAWARREGVIQDIREKIGKHSYIETTPFDNLKNAI